MKYFSQIKVIIANEHRLTFHLCHKFSDENELKIYQQLQV